MTQVTRLPVRAAFRGCAARGHIGDRIGVPPGQVAGAWRGRGAQPAQRRFKYLAAFLLACLLVFCHGCHGDEDNELFAATAAGSAAKAKRDKSRVGGSCPLLARLSADGIAAYGRGTCIGIGVLKNWMPGPVCANNLMLARARWL
jgi:hypothetical protein